MMVISGCGRQVTGLNAPTGGGIVQPGTTLIRFELAGGLDFANVQYLIVFNTTGNGQQPTAQGYNSDFKNWSYFFIVGGSAGVASSPVLRQVYQDPSSGGSLSTPVLTPTGTLNFQTSIPSGASQFGFQITFNRCLLDLPLPTNNQQQAPSTNRLCPPYLFSQPVWNISLFTLDRQSNPIDSLSTTSPSSADYTFAIDTSIDVNTNRFKPANNTTLQNPGAQITGVEVLSAPTGSNAAPSPGATRAP